MTGVGASRWFKYLSHTKPEVGVEGPTRVDSVEEVRVAAVLKC
jgi:hypothetical protein